MRPPNQNALLVFPGALGDFICFLPTLLALHARHQGRLLVVAKPAVLELIEPLQVVGTSIDRREVADLFGTAPKVRRETAALFGGFQRVYSWTGSNDPDMPRRLRMLTAGSVNIYPFRGMRSGEHVIDYYARCAGVQPTAATGSSIVDDAQWFAAFTTKYGGSDLVVLHAGSGAARKNWHGFSVLVRWCQQRGYTAVLLRGPAEAALKSDAHGAAVLDGLTLGQVAALLRRAWLYVGNDSGITHLAAAVGTRVVALFGPTDPAVWAPRGGDVHVLHALDRCSRCGGEAFCVHRLPAESVIDALDRLCTSAAVRRPEAGGGTRLH